MDYAELLQRFGSAKVTPVTSESDPAVTGQSIVRQGSSPGHPGKLIEQQPVTNLCIGTSPKGPAMAVVTAAIDAICRELGLSPASLREVLSDEDYNDIAEGYTTLSALREYAQLMLEPEKGRGARE